MKPKPPTAKQLKAITALCAEAGRSRVPVVETREAASALITQLQLQVKALETMGLRRAKPERPDFV